LSAYQIGGQRGQAIIVILGPAVFEQHVTALNIAGLAEALAEGGGNMPIFPGR
jgi:hypothetical protein